MKKATRGQPKAQKSTNRKKTGNTSTQRRQSQIEGLNIPAVIGGESDTFKTLKRKAAMLEALNFTMGVVTPACDMVGIHPSTHYHWLKHDEGYANEVNLANERMFDFVETKMRERINEGSDTMLIWYSKTKMKHRGFIERTEVEVTNTPAFVVKETDKGVRKVMDVIHKKTGTNDKS